MPADPNQDSTGLPSRRETFLARYPRKLKLGAVLAIIVVLVALRYFFGPVGPHRPSTEVEIAMAVSGADSRAAIANPAPAPIPGTIGVVGKPGASKSSAPNASSASSDTAAAPEDDSGIFMAPAPDPGLTEDAAQGSLPRIGDDGRQPWQVYARPFNMNDKRPRVAIVITDLGLMRVASDVAIDRLPPNVTLAFDVQSPVTAAWCARARQAGHETILQLPMEPFDYPRSDPGPNTLLSNIPAADNLQRLQWGLMQASGYIGVTTLSGTRFTTDPSHITPVLDELRKRGLMVFDAKVAPHSAIADLARDAHVPVVVDTQRLDQNLAPAAIDEALNQIEQTARLNGRAVAMAPPLPVVLDRLGPWIKQLSRDGIALAPLSAMVQ